MLWITTAFIHKLFTGYSQLIHNLFTDIYTGLSPLKSMENTSYPQKMASPIIITTTKQFIFKRYLFNNRLTIKNGCQGNCE